MDDDIGSGSFRPPYSDGVFEWPIPWEFRVINSPVIAKFCVLTHKQQINALGRVTIWKAGNSQGRSVNDP
jgi:hypothetical protein